MALLTLDLKLLMILYFQSVCVSQASKHDYDCKNEGSIARVWTVFSQLDCVILFFQIDSSL